MIHISSCGIHIVYIIQQSTPKWIAIEVISSVFQHQRFESIYSQWERTQRRVIRPKIRVDMISKNRNLIFAEFWWLLMNWLSRFHDFPWLQAVGRDFRYPSDHQVAPPNRYPGPGIAEEAHGVKTWKNPRSAEGETSHKVRAASFAVKLETSWITWGYQKKEYPKSCWYNIVCILYSSEIFVVHVTFGLFWSEWDLPLYYGWWKFMWQLVEETWTASIPRSGFFDGFLLFLIRITQTLESASGNGKWMLGGLGMTIWHECLFEPVSSMTSFYWGCHGDNMEPAVGHLKGSSRRSKVYNVQGTHKIILFVWIEQNLWCESKREILSSKLWLRFREFFLTNMISKRKYAAGNPHHQLLSCQACGGRNS